ncbi:hypothetical protein NliqN6_4780 [Naganishia liquefaciens]|uniref:sterol esterase n=1 Tax=Naganishia liquefaciens TaxID=104408 RepID=A0A8H3TWI1_9TREE|nr:hypothetical protein NliqN6_4780 [Naganishia liquefaciens]
MHESSSDSSPDATHDPLPAGGAQMNRPLLEQLGEVAAGLVERVGDRGECLPSPGEYARTMRPGEGAPLEGEEALDGAVGRAAMGLPNAHTFHQQARAHRGVESVMTPDFQVFSGRARAEASGKFGKRDDGVPYVRVEESIDYFAGTTALDMAFASAKRSLLGEAAVTDDGSASRASSRQPSPDPSGRSLLRRVLIDRSASPTQHLLRPTFPPPSLSTYAPRSPKPMTLLAKCQLFVSQSISLVVSTIFLSGVVLWAVATDLRLQIPRMLRGQRKKRTFPWDDEQYWRTNEKVSKDPRDYARAVGMDMENQQIETEDGYFLRVNRVIDPRARPHTDGRGGFPVLILHGLFQSSGSFITSEDRSLAFWLASQGGYQVYLGNTRAVYGMGHRHLSTSDPRFWDWTIRELAMYDLPALVEHVCRETGYDKVAFVGHSQGNGLAFISLSLGMCPSLGKKMSLFVALAPAVYAGPLTSGFPFAQLGKIEWSTWKRLFGVLDFIPLMRYSYDYAPAKVFATLGYTMFAFLFNWTDANWLHRRKTKMFRFTPTPVSSASVFWWCGKGGFAHRKCTLDDTLDRWFDDRFPPLSIYYGGRDYLVLTEPLLERLEQKETDVKVIRVEKLDVSEHCDFYWAAEAVEWVYHSLKEDIEKTRSRYPEEIEE